MNKDALTEFLRVIGGEDVRDEGEWLRCQCPLAPWLHSSGKNESRSFVAKSSDTNSSGWYCFRDDIGGRLQRLIHAVWWNSGVYPSEAAKIIWEEEIFDSRDELLVVKRHPATLKKRNSILLPVPQSVLDKYPMALDHEQVSEYVVNERRISEQVVQDYQLRAFMDEHSRLGVIFPIIHKSGVVLDMYVRMIGEKTFFRLNSELSGSPIDYKCNQLLFGAHLIDKNLPLWMTEAPLDWLRLKTLGVRNGGATCGPPKQSILSNLYCPCGVVCAFDADMAGRKFAKKVQMDLSSPSITTVDWSILGKKDANDVDDIDQVRQVLAKAERFVGA